MSGGARVAACLAAVLLCGLCHVATPPPAAADEFCNQNRPEYIPPNSQFPNEPLQRLGARSAWQLATGKGVVVAVVDSGIDADSAHFPPDAVLPGHSTVPGFPDPTAAPYPKHGTAVAGLIAAREVEGSSVVGLAPDAKILPVMVYAGENDAYVQAGLGPRADRMAEGIRWAADNQAHIINVSMSDIGPSSELEEAVAHANRQGALVVASAGNNLSGNLDTAEHKVWPAASPGVLGVTATDRNFEVTDYSVHGPHVDVAAPGTKAYSTYLGGGDCAFQMLDYGEQSKPWTSLAAPFVSAAAALLVEKYPDASPAEISYRLMASAERPMRGVRDDVNGWGLIRPYEALTMTIDPTRAGPPVPGKKPRHTPPPLEESTPVLHVERDPFGPAKQQASWWLMVGAAFVLLTLILGRWRAVAPPRPPRRRRRSREGRRRGDARGWGDAASTAGAAGSSP